MLDWIVNSFWSTLNTKKSSYNNSKFVKIKKQSSKSSRKSETVQREKCDICRVTTLGRNSKVAIPDCCRHIFCDDCLKEWTKRSDASCPIDDKLYDSFLVYNSYDEAITSNPQRNQLANKCVESFLIRRA